MTYFKHINNSTGECALLQFNTRLLLHVFTNSEAMLIDLVINDLH